MIQRRLRHLSVMGMLSMALFAATASAAEHEHALKVGKTGETTFSETTRVGALTFAPGKYKFQHRATDGQHFIHFTQMTSGHAYSGASSTEKAHPGEVQCEITPLDKKVSQTRLLFRSEGEGMRLVRVEVAGENVAHIL